MMCHHKARIAREYHPKYDDHYTDEIPYQILLMTTTAIAPKPLHARALSPI